MFISFNQSSNSGLFVPTLNNISILNYRLVLKESDDLLHLSGLFKFLLGNVIKYKPRDEKC